MTNFLRSSKSAFMPHFFRLLSLYIFLAVNVCSLLPATAQRSKNQRLQTVLEEKIEQSAIFKKGFTGFALFDPESRKYLYSFQADKYFTPASNTKILTFFAASALLRQEAPVVHYNALGDTLLLWGTGYPTLLHPDLVGYDTLGSWLAERPEKTWLIGNGHFHDERYGEGWSWDDYPYGYQMEKAALPVYGNAVRFKKHGHLAPIKLVPSYFQDKLVYENSRTVGRFEDRNIFTFGERALKVEKLDRQVGFRYEPAAVEAILQDTFAATVTFTNDELPRAYRRTTLHAPIPDTLYQALLKDSDNYLAEQFIQMCSAQRYGYISSRRILRFLSDTLLAKTPQPLDWVDGSGLSRYNKATPMSLIAVLDQLHQQIPEKRLFQLFPAGGVSGTIQSWYGKDEGEPYVYAKTGTLRHVHCLSGYLISASGKTYIFSFMHNNFPDKISELKEEMQTVLEWLHQELD